MAKLKRPVPLQQYTVATMAEVGLELGVTAQRISQIEKVALAKMRREFERLGFRKRAGKRGKKR